MQKLYPKWIILGENGWNGWEKGRIPAMWCGKVKKCDGGIKTQRNWT